MRLLHALSIPRLPDGTNLLGFLWATSFIYERLWAVAIPMSVPTYGWAGALISLAVVWSVMDRRRWARLALVGIAAITFVALLLSTLPASPALEPIRYQLFRLLPHYALIISDVAHRDAAILVSLVTIIWLLRRPVREEFDRCKRREMRMWQRAVAVGSLCIWCICQWSSAPAQGFASVLTEPKPAVQERASGAEVARFDPDNFN